MHAGSPSSGRNRDLIPSYTLHGDGEQIVSNHPWICGPERILLIGMQQLSYPTPVRMRPYHIEAKRRKPIKHHSR